ncbi:hypothetical protein ElyMa_001103600 [Elysia marginata]|uniref:Uncharacterized protein n=1 Tax=Elysia marginata TaxID=1093978 RepID=A0AAV4HWS6_9GAST|nr:hypothetical protein ElyMa_001103600 [Elysia marginata]
MWLHVCFGVSSAAQAATRSSCLQGVDHHVTSALMAQTVWPWTQECLEAGPVSEKFEVTSVNVVEESELLELSIQFVSNRRFPVDHGDIRLRNCVLLAVTKWLHTARDVLPKRSRSSHGGLVQQDKHGDATASTSPTAIGGVTDTATDEDVDEDLGSGATNKSQHMSGGSNSKNVVDDKRRLSPKETYICLQIGAGVRTVQEDMKMLESDCFLVLDMTELAENSEDMPRARNGHGNSCRRLQRADDILLMSFAVLLLLARTVWFMAEGICG